MALPKLITPTYELEVPSTDEKISFRPFLVKEEKILLLAMESGKQADIVEAVKQIVSECTLNSACDLDACWQPRAPVIRPWRFWNAVTRIVSP